MSLQVEKLEKNMAKLTIEVSAEELDKAIHGAYLKNKNKFNIPGFRKGKVSQAMIEKMYGAEVFYEEAANRLMQSAYAKEVGDSDLIIVSSPEVDVEQLEKGKPFIFTAEVALKPEVTLGAYKGIEVEKIETEVSEEEITAELDKARNQNARLITIEDRPVQQGDITILDFEGFTDGVAFEGGKGVDHELTIGSGAFIPGFEDQVVGLPIGEEREIHVTFPEQYHAPNLQGKEATFKVIVKEIKVKELPELDDDFAQDVSDFDTLDEYKSDVRAKISERKEKEAKEKKEDKILEKLVENATMEIPDAMLDTQVRQQADDFARRLQQQGLSMEQYMQFSNLTPAKLMDQMRPTALKRIQTRLVLEEVVAAENIVITDEEIDKEVETMAKSYNMDTEKLVEYFGEQERKSMRMDLAVQKAIDLVTEAAVEV